MPSSFYAIAYKGKPAPVKEDEYENNASHSSSEELGSVLVIRLTEGSGDGGLCLGICRRSGSYSATFHL